MRGGTEKLMQTLNYIFLFIIVFVLFLVLLLLVSEDYIITLIIYSRSSIRFMANLFPTLDYHESFVSKREMDDPSNTSAFLIPAELSELINSFNIPPDVINNCT